MSTEAKEPGQRAYEAWLGPRHGSAWLELDDDGKRSWAAVERACAVPAATQDSVDRQQLKAIRDDLLEAGGFEDANCPVSEAVHWAIEELKQLRAAEAGKAQGPIEDATKYRELVSAIEWNRRHRGTTLTIDGYLARARELGWDGTIEPTRPDELRHAKRLLSDVLNGLDGDNWQSEVEMLLNGSLAAAAGKAQAEWEHQQLGSGNSPGHGVWPKCCGQGGSQVTTRKPSAGKRELDAYTLRFLSRQYRAVTESLGRPESGEFWETWAARDVERRLRALKAHRTYEALAIESRAKRKA